MLRLASDCGYPSVHLMLSELTWREHRELTDLMSIEPVGGERMDWHFARLMQLIHAVMGAGEADERPTLQEWLLESMVYAAPEPPVDDADDAEFLDAALTGFFSMIGLVDESDESQD